MAFTGSHYGKPNKTIHAGNVRCQGDEDNLQQCSMTEYSLEEGKQLQLASEVAGVSCLGITSTSTDAIATDAPLSESSINRDSTSTGTTTTTSIIVVLAVIVAILIGGFTM